MTMERLIFFLLTLLLLAPVGLAQTPSGLVPESNLINAKQLLHDLEVLSADDMEGRKPDTPGSAKARAYILKRFGESGIQSFGDSYLQNFTFSYGRDKAVHNGVNIIGYLKGTERPEHFLVISAHYDHLGTQNRQVYNGADDNASGTAALFALAAYFNSHRPANSLIFVAFDAEENTSEGGSKNFLLHPPVKPETIAMNVNMDMICRDKNDILYAVGTYHYPFLKPFLEKIASQARVHLRFGHDKPNEKGVEDWTTESDHIQFHLRKIPFIYFGVEDEEQHHQPTDDYATITPAFYVKAVETIIEAVRQFDEHLPEIEGHKKP